MEYDINIYDTWRIGDYEEAMGGEEPDGEEDEDDANNTTEGTK